MAAEFDFIEWIRARQRAASEVLTPVGDDLAVLRWKSDDLLLVGVDQVLDGVHFDSAVHSPRAIGRKAMNRNLSDCAAMACLPAAAVTTFALPKGVGVNYAKELFDGMREAGDVFDCPIVGGDTGSWSGKLVVTVTILARSAGVTPITRSGAKPGDKIYVTGALGGSLLGRHITFEPRIELSRKLAKGYRITSMIDLSDGLSSDLAHICRQSGVGALIGADRIPVHHDAVKMAQDGRTPLEHALHDGEDYELLFSSPEVVDRELATAIGVMREGESIVEIQEGTTTRPLVRKGWEHTL